MAFITLAHALLLTQKKMHHLDTIDKKISKWTKLYGIYKKITKLYGDAANMRKQSAHKGMRFEFCHKAKHL